MKARLSLAPERGKGTITAALSLALLATPALAARDQLTIGITQFPSTLNPNIEAMVAKSYVEGLAKRPITVHDKSWSVVCMLCVELPTLENGGAVREDLPDGRQGIAVTYRLRPEAKWGDGAPVTVDDVLFTWEVGRHPQSGIANAELYRRIPKVDRVDDRTFTFHMDRVTFDYNAINDFGLLPAHIEREAFAAPPDYRTRTRYDTAPTTPGLWSGPYRLAEVVPGSHIALVRNEHWWGPAPAFRRILVRVVENTAALEANLLSGSVDMIAGEIGLSLDQAIALEKRQGQRFDVITKPGLIYEHLDANLESPVLSDLRVRRALLHALDRQAITDKLFDGRQPVAHGVVSPLDWVFDRDLPTYPFDLARAKALLDEAGWKPGADGVRANAGGERLTIELMTTAGNRTRELVQQVIQQQWKAAGVETRIRNQPARVFFGETVSHRQFGGLALFAWVSAPENVPRTTLHSSMIPDAANNYAGQNYTGFRNPAMDGLIDRIEVELDRDKRRAMWSELQRLYAAELPALPLFFRADAYVLPKWLKGVEPTGHQYPTTLWVENWRVEER